MLNQLLFFLFFETAEPSYGTLISALPEKIITPAFLEAQLESQPLTLQNPNSPVKKTDSIAPVVDAESVFSVDLESGTPLFAREIFIRRPIASIAKLVTAMIILDNHKLNEKIKISKNAATQEGSSMRLAPGEEITVENLLKGMLINSGNDAAVALAEFDAGSEANFVKKMNEKAAQLGLKNTHFSNAKGFDEPENYSTAFDIMIFARKALSYPFIKKTAATKTAEVESFNGKIKHKLESTNELLENPYFNVVGLKTGTSPAAGESYVSLMNVPNGNEVLTVVLNSPNRFKETKIILDWILRNFDFH